MHVLRLEVTTSWRQRLFALTLPRDSVSVTAVCEKFSRLLQSLENFRQRVFRRSRGRRLRCALVWLGLKVQPADVHSMARYMDKDGDGLVSYDEFRQAVGVAGTAVEEEEWSEAAGMVGERQTGGPNEFAGLQPIPIPELAEIEDQEAGEAGGNSRGAEVRRPSLRR